jgi:hypothetical protein
MRRFILILLCIVAVGCATPQQPRIITVEKIVPIPCPEPDIPHRPVLPNSEFVAPSDLESIVALKDMDTKELLVIIKSLKEYSLSLEELLKGYKEDAQKRNEVLKKEGR